MIYEYVTTGGQVAKVEANSPDEAIAKAPDRAKNSGVQLVSGGGTLPSLPPGGGKTLPDAPATSAVTKSLPDTKNLTSRLLRYSSTLNDAVDIARKKRQAFQSSYIREGVAPGVRSASDMASLMSGIDKTGENFVQPLVDTALDLAKSDAEDISGLAKTAATNGAPANVVNDILSAQDYQTALTAAGPYLKAPEKPEKGVIPDNEKKRYSGNLQYTSADIAEGSGILERSKGTDGYVDPTIYQNMYKAWIAKGGLPQDFTKNYPPKLYINPENEWLPANLKSGTGSFTPEDEEEIINPLR